MAGTVYAFKCAGAKLGDGDLGITMQRGARMFGDKSVGLDDPGMLALRRMVAGLRGR